MATLDKGDLGVMTDTGGGASDSSIVVTTDFAIAAGAKVIAAVIINGGGDTSTVLNAPSGGGGGGLTWAKVGQALGSFNTHTGLFYADAPSGLAVSTSFTFSTTNTTWDELILLASYLGLATGGPEDTDEVNAGSSGTAWDVPAMTLTGAGLVVCAGGAIDTTPINTPDGGQTMDSEFTAAFQPTGFIQRRFESGGGSYGLGGDFSGTAFHSMVGATFADAATAGPEPPPARRFPLFSGVRR